LIDVFQAGVLFYRIIEDGRWPFDSGPAYSAGDELIAGLHNCAGTEVAREVENLIRSMMEHNPALRPDPFSRIANLLWSLVSASG
jgi:hypothetical protein